MLRNACVHADGSGGSSAAFAGAAAPLGDGALNVYFQIPDKQILEH